jgi:hypothetical protein
VLIPVDCATPSVPMQLWHVHVQKYLYLGSRDAFPRFPLPDLPPPELSSRLELRRPEPEPIIREKLRSAKWKEYKKEDKEGRTDGFRGVSE